MSFVQNTLDSFPLAKRYGWKHPKRDTGGIFSLYPMVQITNKGYRVLSISRIESLHPDYVTPLEIDGFGNPRFLGMCRQ